MKIKREINFTEKNAKVVIEWEYRKSQEETVLDGQRTNVYNVTEYNDFTIGLYVNDKKVADNTWFRYNQQNNHILIGGATIGTPEMVAAIVEVYEEMKAIVETEKAKAPKTQEEKEEIKKAEQIIAEVERVGEENLLTDKEESVWIKQYNDIHNEGEQGYIPQRATKESYARAIKILERA